MTNKEELEAQIVALKYLMHLNLNNETVVTKCLEKIDKLQKEIKQNKIAELTELMYSNLSNFVVAEMLQNKIDKLTKEIG